MFHAGWRWQYTQLWHSGQAIEPGAASAVQGPEFPPEWGAFVPYGCTRGLSQALSSSSSFLLLHPTPTQNPFPLWHL